MEASCEFRAEAFVISTKELNLNAEFSLYRRLDIAGLANSSFVAPIIHCMI